MTTELKPSGHRAEVFRVEKVRPHPGADRLDLVSLAGYQTVVARGEYREGDLGVFVAPDSLVDVRVPEFSFLAPRAKADGRARIKAVRLRGEPSFGLVVKARPGMAEGDDAASALGVEHYEPPPPGDAGRKGLLLGGESTAGPPGGPPSKYDLESFRRYAADVFTPDEPVYVSEKLDGANAMYCYHGGAYHCSSRTSWKKEYPDYSHVTKDYLVAQGVEPERAEEVLARLHSGGKKRNLWWQVLRETPALEKLLRDNEGVFVLGEVFGSVNCIKYGLPEVNRFEAFDVWRKGRFLDPAHGRHLLDASGVPTAPCLDEQLPYDFERLCGMAEGPTLVEGAKLGVIREGVVVSAIEERAHPKTGRSKLKCVSVAFLEKYR